MEDEIRLDVANETINEGTIKRHRLNSWIEEMTEKLNKMESNPVEKKQPEKNKRENAVFYKLPATIRRNSNRHDYEPQIVSFGPYHHGHDSCKKTQQIKEQVVLQSLKRCNMAIEDYVRILIECSTMFIVEYDELDPKWKQDDTAFLQMMIYDACFFLEILHGASYHHGDNVAWSIDGFNSNELTEYYKHDMLLLENQIPMEVLHTLFYYQTDYMTRWGSKEVLLEMIIKFISPKNDKPRRRDASSHVLEFYRRSLLSEDLSARGIWDDIPFKEVFLSCNSFLREVYSRSPRRRPIRFYCLKKIIQCLLLPVAVVFFGLKCLLITGPRNLFRTRTRANFRISIPSATELDRVGIGFTMSKTTSLNDISFGLRNLRLPQVDLDGTTKSRFLNIIAMEQVHLDFKNQVSSYIYFMSRLLQGADDVRLLQPRGIIHGPLTVNEVVELFSSLIKDIVHDPDDFLDSQYRDMARNLVESYNYKMNNPFQKDLWQNYLRSPLAIVSVIAAFFLFCLTAIQTVYTVLSYYSYK